MWYRATAWTATDPTRGALPGRSRASAAALVVLPPPDPPVLSPLLTDTGPGAADVILMDLRFAGCAHAARATPDRGARDGSRHANARARHDSRPLGNTQPATGSGVWIVSTVSGDTTYRALVRRAAITESFQFVVRITNPIGRTG